MRKIKNTYDAWWFLHDHPKFNVPERIPKEDLVPRKDRKFYKNYHDKGGNNWWVCRVLQQIALTSNLDIHYVKVDETRTINKDKSKNKTVECWLEFGPLKYGYSQPEYEIKEKAREYLQHYHDVDLDCGAATFDQALIILARKVLKKYGDYKEKGII